MILVGGSTRIPKVQKLLSDFFAGKVLNMTVNQDEVVAIGAAVQAAVISGNDSVLIGLVDVISLPLGVETIGGQMDEIIKKNTPIPCTEKRTYAPADSRETQVLIKVGRGKEWQLFDVDPLAFIITNICEIR